MLDHLSQLPDTLHFLITVGQAGDEFGDGFEIDHLAQRLAFQPGGEQGGGWLQALLPAALAFMQAKQAGAETPQAAGQALLAVLGGGQVNPMQSGAPRPAAGGLIAQSLMQAFMNR